MECAICLTETPAADRVGTLCCKTDPIFCKTCLEKCHSLRGECPVCHKPALPELNEVLSESAEDWGVIYMQHVFFTCEGLLHCINRHTKERRVLRKIEGMVMWLTELDGYVILCTTNRIESFAAYNVALIPLRKSFSRPIYRHEYYTRGHDCVYRVNQINGAIHSLDATLGLDDEKLIWYVPGALRVVTSNKRAIVLEMRRVRGGLPYHCLNLRWFDGQEWRYSTKMLGLFPERICFSEKGVYDYKTKRTFTVSPLFNEWFTKFSTLGVDGYLDIFMRGDELRFVYIPQGWRFDGTEVVWKGGKLVLQRVAA